jgi:hypothetical protein
MAVTVFSFVITMALETPSVRLIAFQPRLGLMRDLGKKLLD